MRKLLIIPLAIFAIQLQAQTKLTLKSGYDIHIAGTSSLHDWEMKSEDSKGSMTALVENKILKQINELNIVVVGESLKSGKSGMDKNAHEAIKTDKHKEIVFTSKDIKVDGDKVSATGNLTIAGTTKNTTIEATCVVQSNGDIKCSGSKKIKMTNYNVDPPTAMFGTIKTGDDLDIVYEVTFTK